MAKRKKQVKRQERTEEEIRNIADRVVCNSCMTEPLNDIRQDELVGAGFYTVARHTEKQSIASSVYGKLNREYGVWCASLGPDEGSALYGRMYCADCLREIADILDAIQADKDTK